MEPKQSIVPHERVNVVAALSLQGFRLDVLWSWELGPSRSGAFSWAQAKVLLTAHCLDGIRQLNKELFKFLRLEHRAQARQ